MSDVERESVKNLFSTFNSDFELAHSLHKTLSIPSSKTYEDIRQEIRTIVEEPYKKFYDKCELVLFSNQVCSNYLGPVSSPVKSKILARQFDFGRFWTVRENCSSFQLKRCQS